MKTPGQAAYEAFQVDGFGYIKWPYCALRERWEAAVQEAIAARAATQPISKEAS